MALVRNSIIAQSKSTPYIVRHAVLLSAKHHNEYCWQKQRIGERAIVGPSSGGYVSCKSWRFPLFPYVSFSSNLKISVYQYFC